MNFGSLFKMYRLRSEISTLSELSSLLEEQGFVYDVSLLSRWQKGVRVPRDRRLLLKMIEIFILRKGINKFEEANQLLEAARERDLSESERTKLSAFIRPVNTSTLPEKMHLFIGREQLVKDITWNLITKKKVLLHGPPGVGKTALSIQVGHLLKETFCDGIYWFRSDVKDIDLILNDLLRQFSMDHINSNNVDYKITKLSEIAAKKRFCVILDNIDPKQLKVKEVEQILSLEVPILFTAVNNFKLDQVLSIEVNTFSENEFEHLAIEILGNAFVTQNKTDLTYLGRILGYLPISSVLMLRLILRNPLVLKEYLVQLENNPFPLRDIKYDNKSLFSSIEFSFNNLEEREKNALISSSIFEGVDFSVESSEYINGLSVKQTKKVYSILVDRSLLEMSTHSRYKIHPSIKHFLKSHMSDNEIENKIHKLCKFYYSYINIGKKGDDIQFTKIKREIGNILGLMRMCYQRKLFEEYVLLWKLISSYLWISGKWDLIIRLSNQIEKSYLRIHDKQSLALFYSEDLGRIFYMQNNWRKSEILLNKALSLTKDLNNNTLNGLILQKLGKISLEKNNYDSAENYIKQSLGLVRDERYIVDLIKSYVYLGELYSRTEQYNKSVSFLKLAIKLSNKHKIFDSLAYAYHFLGATYLGKKQVNKARMMYMNGLQVEKKLNRKIGIGLNYLGLAICNHKQGKIVKAQLYKGKAIQILEELNMTKRYEKAINRLN